MSGVVCKARELDVDEGFAWEEKTREVKSKVGKEGISGHTMRIIGEVYRL